MCVHVTDLKHEGTGRGSIEVTPTPPPGTHKSLPISKICTPPYIHAPLINNCATSEICTHSSLLATNELPIPSVLHTVIGSTWFIQLWTRHATRTHKNPYAQPLLLPFSSPAAFTDIPASACKLLLVEQPLQCQEEL